MRHLAVIALVVLLAAPAAQCAGAGASQRTSHSVRDLATRVWPDSTAAPPPARTPQSLIVIRSVIEELCHCHCHMSITLQSSQAGLDSISLGVL